MTFPSPPMATGGRVQAARWSEREHRDVIETIPTFAWTALPDGHVDFVNRRWREYTRLSAEDSAGLGWQAAVHPDDRDRHAEKWLASLSSGAPFESEVRYRRAADGQYRWFLSRAVPLRDEQGRILKWYGISLEIDDQKRAEALLEGEKRILEMVVRGEPLAQTLDSLCRLAEEQAQGVLASILLLEGDRLRHGGAPSLPKAYTDAIDGGVIGPNAGSCGTAAYTSKQVIVCDIASDPLWADYREAALPHSLRACWSTPIFTSEGKVMGTFAMYYREPRGPSQRDQELIEQITHLASVAIQRKLGEEALRNSERQFRALFDQAAIGITLVTLAGHAFESNRKLQQMLGYSAEEFHTLHFATVTHPDDLDTDASLFAELVSGRRDYYQIEKRYYRKDGGLVWADLTVSLVRNDGGEPLFGIAIIEDITDRKRVQEELGESERRIREMEMELAHANRVATMGQLTASIAHEVRQPVTATVAYAQAALRWLGRQPPDVEKAREALAGVVRDCNRAGDVIGRIRDLIKKTWPRKDSLEINEAIREVIVLAGAEAVKNGVSIQIQLAEGLPLVQGDRVQLQQVMLNLIINAVEAMSSDDEGSRELLINTRKSGPDAVLVAVQDSGPGLDPTHPERVFQAFYTTKPGGLGMGLSICRSIVEAHGGRLWATGSLPRGAIFQFTLRADPGVAL